MALMSTHNFIANDPQLAPRYVAAQEQAISHFEAIFRLLGNDSVHDWLRIWNTLPNNLKIREYHSPQRLREALNKTPMYK